jgi:hypothetical protein
VSQNLRFLRMSAESYRFEPHREPAAIPVASAPTASGRERPWPSTVAESRARASRRQCSRGARPRGRHTLALASVA